VTTTDSRVRKGIVMDRFVKTLGKTAVATGVATAILTSSVLQARPTEAGSPQAQDAAKAEVKVQVTKEVITKKAEQAPAKAVAKEAAVVTRQVMAVPLAPMIVQAQPANAEAMAQQFIPQFRPILKVELRVLTKSSEPSPTQRREIALEGGKALKQAAVKMAEVQLGLNNLNRGLNGYPDPRKMIRDAMEATAKEKLSPEQFGRYQKELERRAKDYREATMLNLVANLDKLLILSADQRDKLGESLLANWDDRTYPTLENLVTYEAYYPMIPDQHLNSILTEEQRKIWRGAQKLNFGSIRNFNFFNNGMVNGVVEEEDEDVKAALADEVKK
jgi:hypothetical protein